jgi:ABC-type transport system involved in multi-copper enzyme maturation permease subunit
VQVKHILYEEGGKAFRPPSPLNFLSQGLDLFLPTIAETPDNCYRLKHVDLQYNNSQGQNYLYDHYYGPLDLSFIVSVVMSFFAFAFTFSAIAGEKEKGTLGLILSNPVARHHILFAKVSANFFLLYIAFLISFLAGSLILLNQDFPLFDHGIWPLILLALLISTLFIGVCFNLGLFVSTLTKRTVSAIVILLLFWVFFIGLLPKFGTIMAQFIYPIQSQQIIDVEKNQIRLQNENECEAEIDRLIETMAIQLEKNHSDKNFTEQQETIRAEFQSSLIEELQKVDSDFEMRKNKQTIIAMNLARLSPASCFIRPLAEISRTGLTAYQQFLEKTNDYQRILNADIFSKNQYRRYKGGVSMSFSGDINSIAPQYHQGVQPINRIIAGIIPDFILLILYNLVFFMCAYIAFLKYDAR